MFNRYFPYGQTPSLPNINPLLSLGLGLPVDTTSISSGQDLSSLLLSAQPNISATPTLQASSPYFLPQATQLLAGLPLANAVNPLMVHLSLSQVLPPLNPVLLQQQTSELSSTSANTTDSHTIVRAPVFYGNSNGNIDSQISSSKEANRSPPDQIVETYAAAVRAAAIAHQQPLSNAAEVFLSTAASAASSLASSNGTGVTTAKNRASQRRVSAGVSSPIGTTVKASLAGSSKPPLPWNSTWTRMVDRQADMVVYMSPGGSRLKSMADVRAHLKRWLPAERASAITDNCINSSFCFDATRESRFVSAPDDSIFVFPENTVSLTTTTAMLPISDNAPSPTPSSSLVVQQPDSGVGDTTVTMSTASNSSETSVITTAESVVTNSASADGGSSAVISLKRSAPESESTGMKNGAETFSAETTIKPETLAENASKEEDSTPAAKLMKLEPKFSSSLVQMPLPSRSDTAQTTPSFVARSMARAGGPTTVVPSVVPSVLPPSTTTSASNVYALVQHLASIQHQQALLASAGLIHPVVDATAQQLQLLEHIKQQQAVAATALFLQQQNQHHLQLQQHLQAVYASAIQQQQQQQALQQQQLFQQQNSNNQNGGGQ